VTENASGKDFCIVHHQKVPGVKKCRQVGHMLVLQAAFLPVHNHHPRIRSLREWFLGNEFGGEVVVEGGGLHEYSKIRVRSEM
jgi:hypothetical protein